MKKIYLYTITGILLFIGIKETIHGGEMLPFAITILVLGVLCLTLCIPFFKIKKGEKNDGKIQ